MPLNAFISKIETININEVVIDKNLSLPMQKELSNFKETRFRTLFLSLNKIY